MMRLCWMGCLKRQSRFLQEQLLEDFDQLNNVLNDFQLSEKFGSLSDYKFCSY